MIWLSLRNAPSVEDILEQFIQFLSQQETRLPGTLDEKIARLIHYLRAHRCLLVPDNGEELQIYRPNGERFATYVEIAQRLEQEQQRAARLAGRLRTAGIDPE